MDDVYENIEEHNPNKELKITIISDMIAECLVIKKLLQ